MFGQFLRALAGPAPAPASPPAQAALAALLVRIARADGHYSSEEAARIEAIIAARYGLDATAARSLREQAEVLEVETGDNVRLTRALKDAVPYEDRETLVEALWSVVLADGARSAEEDGLLRLLVSLLGVADQDSAFARQRAERTLAGGQDKS